MNWRRLLVKAGKWLLRKGTEELLKEAQKRKEKPAAPGSVFRRQGWRARQCAVNQL